MEKPIQTMLSIQATPDISEIRIGELHGQEHTIIPCIALVEGVLWPANAPSPELALAEEFGRFPEGWNGRPVMYDHPKVNGQPVSASSPDVLQDTSFGQLFNTKLEEGKLKTEIWINEARVPELDEEAQKVIANLKDGEGIAEVSTGLFTMQEPLEGKFDGQEYSSVWRNIVPDHLAVLPEGITGACSVADGAGAPRLNEGHEGCMRALQLNTAAGTDEEGEEEQVGIFKRLLDIAGGLLPFTNNSSGVSDSDVRQALNAGLRASTDNYVYILAVYDSTFVYESGWDGTLFENTFLIGGDGSITIGSEPTLVRPVTTFVPVVTGTGVNTNSTIQENAMNEKLVNDLITNAGTGYTEDDREWLSTLEEGQLEKMVPVEVAPVEVEVEAEAEVTPVEVVANAAPATPVNTEDYIAAASPEIQEVLKSGLRMHSERKAVLVTALTANARCNFTEDDLNSRTVPELENLAALANDISFEGQATVLRDNAEEQDTGFTPAPTIFKTAASS